MYLDASAIIALILNTDKAGYLSAKIEDAKTAIYYSATAVFEAVIFLAAKLSEVSPDVPKENHLDNMKTLVDELLQAVNARPMAMDANTYKMAIDAAKEFVSGKQSYCAVDAMDCFSVALSRQYRVPLALYDPENKFDLINIDKI